MARVSGAPVSDLALAERILDATSTITGGQPRSSTSGRNDAADVATSYRRIAARHGGRFLLGIGVGHPESVTAYRQPYVTMVNYLDQLDVGGVPPDRPDPGQRSAPEPCTLAAERTLGTPPVPVPSRTIPAPRSARCSAQVPSSRPSTRSSWTPTRTGPGPPPGRSCPTLSQALQIQPATLRRLTATPTPTSMTAAADRLIDALVLHGPPDVHTRAGLRSHLDAGADHVAIQVLTGNGTDPIPAYRQHRSARCCDPAAAGLPFREPARRISRPGPPSGLPDGDGPGRTPGPTADDRGPSAVRRS